ncbi:MAG TPA: hypothetical protein VJL10_01145 [Anaerolineales bacterium]|nr:hypothetical protein [Anaerolineales bacterium]
MPSIWRDFIPPYLFEYSAGAKNTITVNASINSARRSFSIEWNLCSTFFATYTIEPACTSPIVFGVRDLNLRPAAHHVIDLTLRVRYL